MTRAARRAIARLWSRVPDVECQGLCTEACGPIAVRVQPEATLLALERLGRILRDGPAMSRAEWRIIVERVGHEPEVPPTASTCPLLVDGRCSVYDVRPLICRIWGAVEEMACPFGCRPQRWLPREASYRLLADAEDIP